MKKNRIRLTESQLNRMINEHVKHVINEQLSDHEDFDRDEWVELVNDVRDAANEMHSAITELASWYCRNVEKTDDLYNSYAGKYSENAKSLLSRSYNILGSMLKCYDD